MITLNVVGKRIVASVFNDNFSVPYTKELHDEASVLFEASQDADTKDVYDEVVEKFKALFVVSKEAAETVSKDLIYDPNTRTYHLNINGTKHPVPMPQKLVDDLLYAKEHELPTGPIVKFWTRLLRNHNIRKNDPKNVADWTNSVAEYVTRTFVSPGLYKQYTEEGYSHEVATEMSTVRQTPFTMEGLVCTKKVVEPLLDRTKFKFIQDAEGNPKKVLRDSVQRSIDEDTGDVNDKVTAAEDWVFEPLIMHQRGDAFFSGEGSKAGHIIRVGNEMFLESWDQVNCDFNASCVKGIHTGNQDYINGYEREDSATLNCFVDPAEIGAVACGDDVLRVRALFPHSIKNRETDNRGLYHSSKYAEKKDAQWETIRAELAEEYKKKQEEYMKALAEKSALVDGI